MPLVRNVQNPMEGGTDILAINLCERRKALGMSVDDLAREARVSALYARALEEGDWDVFPAKIYARGILMRIAGVLEPGDGAAFLEMLDREWLFYAKKKSVAAIGQSGVRREPLFLLTPGGLRAILAGGILLAILGFLGVRLVVFTAPPSLAVLSPEDRAALAGPTVRARGTTEKESRLTVNGRELTIDERGNFDEEIELPLGPNRLQFISESRFGKVTREVRHILMR